LWAIFLIIKARARTSLLILIPAYNEEARIEPVLRDYAQFFQKIISARRDGNNSSGYFFP
jgi:hypothetical protein